MVKYLFVNYFLIIRKLITFTDINECDEESQFHGSVCHRYANCLNTYGAYNCSCMSGFVGDGTDCVDVDECALYPNPAAQLCNNTGVCVNTVGYFRCDCLVGYTKQDNANVCTGFIDQNN